MAVHISNFDLFFFTPILPLGMTGDDASDSNSQLPNY